MQTESNIYPNPVTIEPHGTDADIIITENVTEIDREETTIYQYDSYRLTVRNRPNLLESVQGNLGAWLEMAKAQESKQPEPTLPERVDAIETTTGEIITVLADIVEVAL